MIRGELQRGPFSWHLASTFRAGLRRFVLAPVDIAWLAIFRVLFGTTMFISMLRFISYGWVDELFVEPRFHFVYWALPWAQAPGATAMHALFIALAGSALAMALGFAFRLCAWVFFFGVTYLQAIDVSTYLNHYYLASLLTLLLACSPANGAWSVDVWARPALRTSAIAAGWVTLFRLQMAIVYTFAGLAKATSDWLLAAQPLGIWLASRTGIPIIGPLLALPWAAPAMSWAGFLFDTTIPIWMLISRTRPWAYAVVLVFHGATRALFPIGMFPFIMIVGALVFFPPAWPRSVWAKLRRRRAQRAPRAPTESSRASAIPASSPQAHRPALDSAPWPWQQKVGWLAAALYIGVQVALPLRSLAYGGNVLWHEQGMRFSWRVMVREKNGSVTYLVRSKKTGRQWEVAPAQYLTSLQEREMAGQPDLILQLAHRIRDDALQMGAGPVQVRADAFASLNGRRSARLIDPAADLATIEDSLLPARWILPAPSDAPPQLRTARVR